MINIPETTTKRWVQANSSDLLGNIWYTKNISFDNVGYLSLSNSPRTIYNEALSGDFDNVNGIEYYSSSFYATTWNKMWSINIRPLIELPTIGVSTPSGDIEGSMCYFGDDLVVVQDTDVDYKPAGDWVDTNISLTSSGQHDSVHFLSQNALAIADVNTVKLYAAQISATPTLITTLTIPEHFEITKMEYLNQYLYIGTKNKNSGKAALFVWNGSGTGASQVYEVTTPHIQSLCAHNNSIYILESNGAISRFNGSGFTQVAALPIFYVGGFTSGSSVSIYKGVMQSNGRVIYINFSDSTNSTRRILNQPDGIWCYDENIGLYHKYSNTLSQVVQDTIGTADVNTTTSVIKVTAAPVTGTEVYYENDGGTSIAGLTTRTKYFVIKVDATSIKLATTKANALAGTAISLTGTGNITQSLIFFPNIDYGAFYVRRPTYVRPMNRIETDAPMYGTDIFWSTEVNKGDSETTNWATLQCTSTGVESRGYFVTSKILSNDVTDYWKTFVIKYQPMQSELDKIIVKYRTQDDGKEFIDERSWDITWTSTSTFTSTETGWADASAGDEVEILIGAGAGLIAHISTITESSGTYTVTLDETYDNYASGDLAVAIFRNWKKLCTITSSETNGYTKLELGNKINGKFIQFKIELRGIGVKIEELSVDDVKFLPK
jgi:hypothetical protein